jgi:hypothetical protein
MNGDGRPCSSSPNETAYKQFLHHALARFSKNVVLKISRQARKAKISGKSEIYDFVDAPLSERLELS